MAKIGIDAQWSAYPHTGIGKLTIRWVEQLAELDQTNHYVLFCSRQEDLPAELRRICLQRPNFSWQEVDLKGMRRLPGRASLLLRDQFCIPKAAYAHKCRLIFFPYFNPSLLLLPRAVVCITDFSIFVQRKDYPLLKGAYYNGLLKAAAKWAIGLLAISKATQNDAVRHLGVSADRVRVIYPGVEEHFSPVAKNEARAWCQTRYGIDFAYILYSGGFAVRKNLPRLWRAFKKVRERLGNNLKLVMTGKPDESSEIFKLLKNEDQSPAVFLERIPEGELKYLYSAAELAVYPSLYEGFGLPILEAQACGVPVVTSNVTSMPEVAGGAAILADPTDEDSIADAIVRGLTDQALRNNLIREGLVNSRQFTWKNGAQQLLDLFEQSISRIDTAKRIKC